MSLMILQGLSGTNAGYLQFSVFIYLFHFYLYDKMTNRELVSGEKRRGGGKISGQLSFTPSFMFFGCLATPSPHPNCNK